MATELSLSLHPNAPDENEVQALGLASPSPQPRSLESNSIGGRQLFSLQEFVDAGFSAEELKDAGFDLRSLKTAGFNFKQLKEAGFKASAFKSDGYDLSQLKSVGFTAEELKEAGFDFASLKEMGFHPSALRIAGFNASDFKSNRCSLAEIKRAGFTAKEIAFSAAPDENRIDSEHHRTIDQLIRDRFRSGLIFGQTWREFFAFFAPFGTKNSFWNRLCKSPMIRHIFVHDSNFVDDFGQHNLTDESPSARVTATDVDSSVNSCALICALLISIPSGLVNNMADSDFYTTIMISGWGRTEQRVCHAPDTTNASSDCFKHFEGAFQFLTQMVLASFYLNIFVLILAVLYYMCRPAESYNNSSLLTLLEAFTLEVRERIRRERHATFTESDALPSQPFDSSSLESEVFFKASFLAQNEAEEQKDQEFYMWYKSKTHSEDVFFF
jgi:ribosomal protein L13E